MNRREEFKKYPICDTDIWVKICLGQICDKLFAYHKKIIVADVVQGEILKWDRTNSKFSFIAGNYKHYRKIGNILVINHSYDIYEEDRMILERQLYDLGFENDFNNKPPESNKGEFVSAIYADYFGIPFMKSDDGIFSIGEKGQSSFPNLKIKNWNTTVHELIQNDIERIKVTKLASEQNLKMNKENEFKYNLNKDELFDDEPIEIKLKKLQLKYNKK